MTQRDGNGKQIFPFLTDVETVNRFMAQEEATPFANPNKKLILHNLEMANLYFAMTHRLNMNRYGGIWYWNIARALIIRSEREELTFQTGDINAEINLHDAMDDLGLGKYWKNTREDMIEFLQLQSRGSSDHTSRMATALQTVQASHLAGF
jgi:hypothetical protein